MERKRRDHPHHGRMNYKDTKPYMSAFLSVDLFTDFAAFWLTDFIDWRYIHSWFAFSTQLVNCCPQGRRNYTLLVYFCPSTVPSLWPPSPCPPSQCTLYTDIAWLWGGGGEGSWNVLWTIFCRSFLTRFRTYKIASTPLTKMTSKDDIKGLVSLKFLRPWSHHIFYELSHRWPAKYTEPCNIYSHGVKGQDTGMQWTVNTGHMHQSSSKNLVGVKYGLWRKAKWALDFPQ